MKQWEITWAACPTNYNPQRVSRVEAETKDDAERIVWDAIRATGVAAFSIFSCIEYKKPTVKGRVISL